MTDMEVEALKIRGEFTPDPAVCRFVANRAILEGWTIVFNGPEDSLGSPLIDGLFAEEGVESIQVQENAVTVTKAGDETWPKLASKLIPVIKGVLLGEEAALSCAAVERMQELPPVEDMAKIINGLFEQYINPAIASHGGSVRLLKIDDRDVYVEMQGGCQGCSASKATMKNGIEKAIREALPQVRDVIDMTDHDAGDNPYYA